MKQIPLTAEEVKAARDADAAFRAYAEALRVCELARRAYALALDAVDKVGDAANTKHDRKTET
jgi:hypothetical protein